MAENISLQDAINNALADYLKASGSIMTNYVFCADILDNDGGSSTIVLAPENASPASSLGLAEYAKTVYVEKMRMDLHAAWAEDED